MFSTKCGLSLPYYLILLALVFLSCPLRGNCTRSGSCWEKIPGQLSNSSQSVLPFLWCVLFPIFKLHPPVYELNTVLQVALLQSTHYIQIEENAFGIPHCDTATL